MKRRRKINLSGMGRIVALSVAGRTITGEITVYGPPSSSQRVILHDAALSPREPINRVKLLRDHNQGDPVGFMSEVDDAVRVATFTIPEGENGDRALEEAQNGLRDGFSVGFSSQEYAFDDDGNFHVYAAELYEVSLCAIPDFNDARVTDVAATLAAAREEWNTPMNEAQLRAALAAGTITQATFDRELSALPVELRTPAAPAPAPQPTPAPETDPSVPTELRAGPTGVPLPTPIQTRDRGLSMHDVGMRLSAAAVTGDIGTLQRAIGDVNLAVFGDPGTGIVPANDGNHQFIGRPDYIGEVWTASTSGREWIDSLGGAQELTGTKIEGYRWGDTPTPEKYAGNLALIPTSKFSTVPVTAEPERWAWGARIDRIYRDLGSPDLIAALFAKLAVNYDLVSDFDVAAKVLAQATRPYDPPVGQAAPALYVDASVLIAIAAVYRSFRRIGATVGTIWLADDLFDAWSMLKLADLPAWLAGKLGFVNLADGTAAIESGTTTIRSDSKLGAGDLVAYDKRAVTVREKKIPQLEAIVIPNDGIDLGFFSYGGILVNDPRAVVRRKVAAA